MNAIASITTERAREQMSQQGWLIELRIAARGKGCTNLEAALVGAAAENGLKKCTSRRRVWAAAMSKADALMSARRNENQASRVVRDEAPARTDSPCSAAPDASTFQETIV